TAPTRGAAPRPSVRRSSTQDALVLYGGELRLVVFLHLLDLLPRHLRHEVTFLVDLRAVERNRHRALTDAEKAADIHQPVQLLVGQRPRDTRNFADVFAVARVNRLANQLRRLVLRDRPAGLLRLLLRP